MPTEVHCPQCASENVRFSRKTSSYDCEDCQHVWEAKKPSSPLRILLSYGHDANEELVLHIKADLEKHGHDVWFDKSEIKFGDDWRRSITDGILHSQRAVSFLSKHSTRGPGVCRDEIAIALGVKGGNIQTNLSLDRPGQFPQGLGAIFFQWFQRQFHDLEEVRKDMRRALRAILAVREPVPVEILQRLLHWQAEELRDFIRTLGSPFPAKTIHSTLDTFRLSFAPAESVS